MAKLDENWRKSSKSYLTGDCVEVRWAEPFVEVRDSKDTTGPVLRFTPDAWTAFLGSLKDGSSNHACTLPAGPQMPPRRP